MRIEF